MYVFLYQEYVCIPVDVVGSVWDCGLACGRFLKKIAANADERATNTEANVTPRMSGNLFFFFRLTLFAPPKTVSCKGIKWFS